MRHTLKIWGHLLQDFQSVFDHFGTLCIKGLTLLKQILQNWKRKMKNLLHVMAIKIQLKV